MNRARIDPLALLAIEADARSKAELYNVQQTHHRFLVERTGPIGTLQSQLQTNQRHDPSINETQHHVVSTACTNVRGSKISMPSAANDVMARKTTPSPTADTMIVPAVSSHKQTNRRKPSFAMKLHSLLADNSSSSLIRWLPDGKAFVILNKKEFTLKCIPKFFRGAKYESFSRRLKRWGFQKIHVSDESQAVYFHELFQRGKLDLCKAMNGHGKDGSNDHVSKLPDPSMNATVEQEIFEIKRLARLSECAESNQSAQKHQLQVKPSLSNPNQVPLAPGQAQYHVDGYKPASAAVPYHQEGYIDQMFTAPTNAPHFHMDYNPATTAFPRHQERHFECAQNTASGHPNVQRYSPYPAVQSETTDAQDLSYLDKEIAGCEEQLAILLRLKALKERRRMLH